MAVVVEFFGIPRQRAGVAAASAKGTNLAEVLQDLARQFPALGECCLDGRHLKSGYVASLAGDRFVSDPETPLAEGQTLLIFSADAGG